MPWGSSACISPITFRVCHKMPVTLNPTSWVNWDMAREPLNWLIVGTVASIWLMAFHAVMTGFTAMQGASVTGQSIGGGGPGTIAAPQASVVGNFAIPGNTGSTNAFGTNQWFGTDQMWTNGFESRFAEDGWTGDDV